VLLSVVMDAGLGYPMMRREALAEHHKIPCLMPETPDIELLISCLAFVDDSTWIGRDKQSIQKIVDIAQSFYALNSIEINPKKSELLVINPTLAPDELTIQLGNDILKALSPGTSARMLGVWFSADGKGVYTRQIVQQEVSSICKVLSRKAITDKQVVYIINNVLIPRILYRLTTTILTASEVARIVGQYCGMVKQKLGLPRETPNSILHHRRLYGLRHFGDVQEEEQISTALLRLNDHGLVGQVMEARSLAHQAECRLPVPTCQFPETGAQFTKHNFLGHVCRLMHNRKVNFTRPSAIVAADPIIATLLPAKTYRKLAYQLAKDKVVYLRDVTTEDGTAIASWSNLKQRLQIKGPSRRWYHTIGRTICIQPDIDNNNTNYDNSSNSDNIDSTEAEDSDIDNDSNIGSN
ncbi:hypothetical protein BGZ46_005822, partial [Entomortierella lignicola]